MGWVLKLLRLGSLASPELRAAITAAVDEWVRKAAETANPADDLAMGALKGFLYVIGIYGH